MNKPLDALYGITESEQSMVRWLFDSCEEDEYFNCSRFTESQSRELKSLLSGSALDCFERLLENIEEKHTLEKRIMFNQGVSVGISLGSLGI